jgi:hypothetical protein
MRSARPAYHSQIRGKLVTEVARPSNNHHQPQLIHRSNHQIIAPRDTRLPNGADAMLGGFLDGIGEGKEGI